MYSAIIVVIIIFLCMKVDQTQKQWYNKSHIIINPFVSSVPKTGTLKLAKIEKTQELMGYTGYKKILICVGSRISKFVFPTRRYLWF